MCVFRVGIASIICSSTRSVWSTLKSSGTGYDQLLSFIAGINAKDYDLTHVFIDSIFKVTKDENLDNLATFLANLESFIGDSPLCVTVVCSSDVAALPEGVKKFC